MQRPHVFISYVREDKAAVARLRARLEQAGIAVWQDVDAIAPGESWPDATRRAIAASKVFVACFSRTSLVRPRTEQRPEIAFAGTELPEVNLVGTNLAKATLADVRLPAAQLGCLIGADCGEAPGAWLWKADLRGADLHDAWLGDAKLHWANLDGTDLSGAYLRGSSFWTHDLDGTSFRDADLCTVQFWVELDLRQADLAGAIADSETTWPPGFDWEAAGVDRLDRCETDLTGDPRWSDQVDDLHRTG